ncbi:MAG: hypothetical protein WAV40_00385 [Microgenomates group bacterium]
MKQKHIFILFLFLAIFSLSGNLVPILAVAPPSEQQIADRLVKAKKVCLGQISERDALIAQMITTLNKKQKALLAPDFDALMSKLTNMQSTLQSWRSEINSASTIEEVKSIQSGKIKGLRQSRVFIPKYNQLYKLGIYTKSLYRIQTRVNTYTDLYNQKSNTDKDKKYEIVGKKLTEINAIMTTLGDDLTTLKSRTNNLTPEMYNTTKGDFNDQLRSIRQKSKALASKIENLFEKLKNLKKVLYNIQ